MAKRVRKVNAPSKSTKKTLPTRANNPLASGFNNIINPAGPTTGRVAKKPRVVAYPTTGHRPMPNTAQDRIFGV